MNNNKNVGEIISNYYSTDRQSFEEFYLSERKTIEFVMSNLDVYEKKILDVGCASGGLYNALNEEYIINYTGIDIVEESIIVAKNKFPECDFICGDISNIQIQKQFDIVFSLSCIDWNLGKGSFEKLFKKLFSFVNDRGYLIISLRISCDDKLKNNDSFQYINFNGKKVGEKVQYGILGMTDLISVLNNSKYLSKVYVNGFEGNPSVTAVTQHKKLLFVVLALEKTTENKKIIKILDLPKKYQNILDSLCNHF